MITVKQAAEKWGLTPRRVQMMCKDGLIAGAQRWERTWMIPATAMPPSKRSSKSDEPTMPMPKRSPFLDMTSLYNRVGYGDESALALVDNPEAQALFEAQIAYRRAEIDKVYEHARYFLHNHSGFYAVLGAGMLLALCAIWRGDIELWGEAKKHICEAPCRNEQEREMITLALAIVDSSVYDNKDFPEWFKRGCFDTLPPDSHAAARVFYIKYLYMSAFAVASREQQIDGMHGLGPMSLIPYAIEPMISQSVVEGTVIPEIYLRLSCAVAYHNSGRDKDAIFHIDKAISLALPDDLYGILVEYVRHFDGLLEERLAVVSEEAVARVKELYKTYSIGWATLSGNVRGRYIATNLTAREREIAKLAAFGMTSRQIAEILYITESTVKQTVVRIVQKTGVRDRSDFSLIL